MYTLHYAPDNASLIIRLALEVAGLPYRTALVDRTVRAQDSAAYRAINPAGRIPALETPDGPIFETGAILLWLADRYPGAGLAPGPGDRDRGACLKWLFFLSNTVHSDLRQLFYPALFSPAKAAADQHTLTSARLKQHFTLLDQAVADTPALFAPPSALGLYLCVLLRWCALYPTGGTGWFRLGDTPGLADLAASFESSPATAPAIAAAIRAEGLGRHLFTAPTHATPPEGSAT